VMVLGSLAMYTVTGWFSDLRWNAVQNTVMFVMLGIVFSMSADIASRGAFRRFRAAERGHEHAKLSMPLDAPEALGGAQQAKPDPPPSHVASA